MLQVKKKQSRSPYSKIILPVLVLLVILLSRSVFGLHGNSQMAKNNKDITESKVKDLESRQKVLQADVDKLRTDNGVEDEIRKNLPVVKDGEKVITIVEEEATTTPTTTPKSFWQWLFH